MRQMKQGYSGIFNNEKHQMARKKIMAVT